MKNKVKIAVVHTRRGMSSGRKGAFTKEGYTAQKERLEAFLKNFLNDDVEFIYAEGLNEEGLMYDVHDADKAYDILKGRDCDGLFIHLANFGCEEAVGRLAYLMKKPVLLWGERDRVITPEGYRPTDTQCGLFAASSILLRHNIKFSYIDNCYIEDAEFAYSLAKFCAVVSGIKAMKGMRIGQVGYRPKAFTSVMYNESELMEKFDIEVIPINAAMVMDKMKSAGQSADKLKNEINSISARFACGDEEVIRRNAMFKLAMTDIAQEYGLSALAYECWSVMPQTLGVLPCLTIGELEDAGIPGVCEGDVLGAVGSVLLEAATFHKNPSFFLEFTMRHPTDDKGELLFHCGNAPYSMLKEGHSACIEDGRAPFCLKTDGPVTLSRFGAHNGKYYLFADELETFDGPPTQGGYLWVKADNWSKWERKFIYGPYIHHISGVYGRYADIMKDICYHIGNIAFDSADAEHIEY